MEDNKKWERRKDSRPAEILEAAEQEFAEQGFASARIESIAKRAGVAKGTVYLYFKTKEALFEGLVRARISPVFSRAATMAEQWPGPQAELLKMLLNHLYKELVDSEQRRMILRTLIAEGGKFEELAKFYHSEILVGARRLLTGIIQRGIDCGEFRNSAIAQEPAVIIGPAILAAVWKLAFEPAESLRMPKWIEAHIDLVLNGLIEE